MMKSLLSSLLLLATLMATTSALPISSSEIEANAAKGLRLLSLEEGEDPVWKTESEVFELLRAKKNFFDVTETYELEQEIAAKGASARAAAVVYPTPSRQAALAPILNTVTIANMQGYLAPLTAFNNRYYKSATGVSASNYILDTVKAIATQYGRTDVVTTFFTHSWVQPSIIARIPGSNPSAPRTILGSHMDSINLSNPTNGRAPGADDDGSGTVNLIEAYRALLQGNFRPVSTVEFHWYAAEEVGLLGSQAIANNYKSTGVGVKAHLQLDMTAYFKPGTKEVLALAPDYIEPSLNDFLKLVINNYSKIPWGTDLACGYACSDHASWYKAGYPTTYPFEAVTGDDNPQIHGAGDTTSVSGFSWTHTLEFAKVATAFAYELGSV